MDAAQRFVQTENIRTLSERLYLEPAAEQRDLLRRLLIEEEDRFGFYAWQLDMAQRHVRDCGRRVAEQQARIAQLQASGQDITLANDLLRCLSTTLESFREFSRRIASELQKGTVVAGTRPSQAPPAGLSEPG